MMSEWCVPVDADPGERLPHRQPSAQTERRLPASLREMNLMAEIVTLTMNPALDIATATDIIEPSRKLRCGAPCYDPGGGGINVARAVYVLGRCAGSISGRRRLR